MSKSVLFTISTLAVIFAALCTGCYADFVTDDGNADEAGDAAEADDRGASTVTAAEIAGRRARVLWEAARAMVGPSAASSYTWPLPAAGANRTLATYAYVAEDSGAWWAAFNAYTSEGITGNDATCTVGNYGCALGVSPYAGLSAYTCQGACTASSAMHGGQCKAFGNLVLYRSGVYHDANWAFRKLPADAVISGNTARFPLAVRGRLVAGDVLRQTSGHSALVVRVLDANSALVLDSNWFSPYNSEIVGTHVMTFSGAGKYDNLGRYQSLNCVYDGSC